jgi:hypothetical protein
MTTDRDAVAMIHPCACLHDWELIAIVRRAPIDERDPIAHTSFYLVGCWTCRTVDAFPASNAALATTRYVEQLRRELRAGGWQLPADITWVAPH